MPGQTASWNPQHHQQYSPLPLPSFMSVFGDDADMMAAEDDRNDARPARHQSALAVVHHHHHHDPPYSLQHRHRGSSSTAALESVESSPTTTISTADSSSLTEPSPSSSPESPIDILPLSSFASKPSGLQSTEELGLGVHNHPPPSPLANWQTGSSSPGKKPRNTKGLSLNMAPSPTRQTSEPPQLALRTASAGDEIRTAHPTSAPPSPSFVVPPKPGPRRRPSKLGLTIQTPAVAPLGGLEGNPKGLRIVPPTPSMKPHLLRHHQSSPSLSILSPSVEPPGGMQLPSAPRPTSHLFHRPRPPGTGPVPPVFEPLSTTTEAPSPVVTQQLDGLQEEDAEYDPPLSQEVKSPAYPAGPVCIYDPHVYLYLEPSKEEAYQFDVVINVAREVRNPFGLSEEKSTTPVQTSRPGQGQSNSEPGTACTTATFQTAFENQPTPTTASPTTPRATAPRMQPEYIHMPWDHNTSIVDDLVVLVETIDERVKQGKKVLIHCQCGVSRSASLIVAYGIYKNPSLTVQEAYDAVKQRSRWIGPNMSLIYQLSEFRNKIVKQTGAPQAGYRSWRAGGGMRANTITSASPTTRPSLSLEPYVPRRQEPQTAPLPQDRDRTPRSSPMLDEPQGAMSAKQLSPPSFSFGDQSPINAISAPLDGPLASWPLPATPFGTNQHEPVAPVEEKARSPSLMTAFPPLPPEPPARASLNRILRMSPSHPQLRLEKIVPHTINLPPPSTSEPNTPGLLSPRTEFMANPFLPQIAAASSFGFSSNFGLPDGPVESTTFLEQDPRSPAQRGEAPIVRSIFDVL